MVTKVKVSTVVDRQLPVHFLSQESEISSILKEYYKWMESSGGVLDSSQKIHENFYLDSSDIGFLKFFTKRVIPNIPQDALIDKKLLTKYARQFYQTKGSETSFKFLFRAIFGKSVDVYYPKTDLLRTSSAKWNEYNTIKVYTADTSILNIVGRRIIGASTGALAIVETVNQYQSHYVLTLRRLHGIFNVGEQLYTEPTDGRVYFNTYGQINAYSVTAGGSGYSVGDLITTTGGDGSDFLTHVDQVSDSGAIEKIRISDGGFGYTTTAPTFVNSSGTGASITFYIGAVLQDHNFLDDTDFLSSTKKLQDGNYYQEFSYVLKSAVPSNTFKIFVDSLIHPSGTKQFSELSIYDDVVIDSSYVGMGDTFVYVTTGYNLLSQSGNIGIGSFGIGIEIDILSTVVDQESDIILPYAGESIFNYATVAIQDIKKVSQAKVKFAYSEVV